MRLESYRDACVRRGTVDYAVQKAKTQNGRFYRGHGQLSPTCVVLPPSPSRSLDFARVAQNHSRVSNGKNGL